MVLVRRIMVLAAGAILTAGVAAQSPTDFSGTWVLTSTGVYPPDRRLTITQDAATLTIEGTAYRVRASSDGTRSTWSETPYPTRITYRLDGLEHPYVVVANPPPIVQAPSERAMTSTIEESVFKATWVGQQLVVMRHEKESIRTPGRTPAVVAIRKTIRETMTLDAGGTLVWETLAISDPLPWSREAPLPAPLRRLYKRSSALQLPAR
jgi:hypothetical protein